MKKVYIIFSLFLIINNLIAQSDKTSKIKSNKSNLSISYEMVLTPMGPRQKSKVHFVDSEHHLNIKDGHIQIIETKTGKVSQEFDNFPVETNNDKNRNIVSKLKSKSSTYPSGFPSDNGWITYAYWSDTIINKPITYFSTNWIVPAPPTTDNNQIIYLFNGLEGSDGVSAYILQPVLQWGYTSAGGGNYWAITNWFVSSSGECFYGTLAEVSPGTNLQGVMKLTSDSGNTFSYNSSFKGYASGNDLQINNISLLFWACETLEAYNITGCSDYPADQEVKMTKINIKTDSIYPSLLWTTKDTITECGQQTVIMSNSPDTGEVDIHFWEPASPCTGTPKPGNTLSSANPVCTPAFTLSLQNATIGSGVTYQWQSSTNDSLWSNIIGAIDASYTASQTDTTWYRCKVSCSGDTGTSNALKEINTPPPTTPTAGTHTPSENQIIWNWNPVTGAAGYKWNTINDYNSAIGNGTSTSYTQTGLTSNTQYTLYVWSYNICGNSAVGTLKQSTTKSGIVNLNNEQHLNIYPNPVANELIIETNSHSLFNISLTNIVGQSNYNSVLNKKVVIDMKYLAHGMYIIKIYNENETVVRKIIKE